MRVTRAREWGIGELWRRPEKVAGTVPERARGGGAQRPMADRRFNAKSTKLRGPCGGEAHRETTGQGPVAGGAAAVPGRALLAAGAFGAVRAFSVLRPSQQVPLALGQ